MARGFSKIGIGITAVVIFFLLALAVQLFCVFWCRRRRRFSREISSATPSDVISTLHHPSSTPSPVPSKELLYFLYCNKQSSCVEAAGAVPSPAPRYPGAAELTDISRKLNGKASGTDASMWWMGMYDPSRLLQMHALKADEKKTKKSSFAATDDLERGATVLRETTTPFSTPCASPPFYTPLSSPRAERKSGCRNPARLQEKTSV